MSACLALADDGRSVRIPLRLVRGAEAVLTQCLCRLQTERGHHPDDTGLGMRWSYYRLHTVPEIEIEGDARSQLREIAGVLEVLSVRALKTAGTLTLLVRVRVAGEDGPVTADLGAVPEERGFWFTILFPSSGVMP